MGIGERESDVSEEMISFPNLMMASRRSIRAEWIYTGGGISDGVIAANRLKFRFFISCLLPFHLRRSTSITLAVPFTWTQQLNHKPDILNLRCRTHRLLLRFSSDLFNYTCRRRRRRRAAWIDLMRNLLLASSTRRTVIFSPNVARRFTRLPVDCSSDLLIIGGALAFRQSEKFLFFILYFSFFLLSSLSLSALAWGDKLTSSFNCGVDQKETR